MKFRLLPLPTETVGSLSRHQASDLGGQMNEDGQPVTGVLGCGYHLGAGPIGELIIHIGSRQRENEQ